MAQTALEIAPDDFDAHIALGVALLASGGKDNADKAVTAYRAATQEAKQMEPTSQEKWMPALEKKLATALIAAR